MSTAGTETSAAASFVVNDPMGFNIVNTMEIVALDGRQSGEMNTVEKSGIYTNIVQLAKELHPSLVRSNDDDDVDIKSTDTRNDVVVTIEMGVVDTNLSSIMIKQHEGYTVAVQLFQHTSIANPGSDTSTSTIAEAQQDTIQVPMPEGSTINASTTKTDDVTSSIDQEHNATIVSPAVVGADISET